MYLPAWSDEAALEKAFADNEVSSVIIEVYRVLAVSR